MNKSSISRMRTTIAVSGFTETEVTEGLPHLLAEFRERPWLLKTDATWDSKTNRLFIIIECEGKNPVLDAEATFDEVWDCVIATMDFVSEQISFDILESVQVT
jgi:hypothetical protein